MPERQWNIFILFISALRCVSTFQVGRSAQGEAALRQSTIDTKHLIQPDKQKGQAHLKPLVTLSKEPLLLVSTEPVLTPSECKILSQHFHYLSTDKRKNKASAGQRVVQHLQKTLDDLIGRDPAEGTVQPRFLVYEPEKHDFVVDGPGALLPDGLHVDINNGFLFRYLTVLVYLTSSKSSATNFPLAASINTTDRTFNKNDDKCLVDQAQFLLDENVHHTRNNEKRCTDACQTLEEKAFQLFQNQNVAAGSPDGVRILPRQGHVTVFLGVDSDSGTADPRSWHGSEHLAADDNVKEVLTFFYEIPVTKFKNRREFGKEVGRRKRVLMEKYYCERLAVSV